MKIKKALENLYSFYLNWVILSAEKMRSEEVMKKRKKIKKKIRETRNSSLPETTLGHLCEVALLV